MVVKNGCERKVMIPNDFKMRSIDPRRIILPYTGKLWGDIYLEALNAVLNGTDLDKINTFADYEEYVKDVGMNILFNIQQHSIFTLAFLEINTVRNEHIARKLVLHAEEAEVINTLAPFFQVGCPGLDDPFLVHYEKVYAGWKNGKVLQLIS